jgi:hypothetical protein
MESVKLTLYVYHAIKAYREVDVWSTLPEHSALDNRRHAVAKLVEKPHHKSAGRGFDSRWDFH